MSMRSVNQLFMKPSMFKVRKPLRLSALAVAVWVSLPASAQTVPDAGRVLQQITPQAPELQTSPDLNLQAPLPATTSGGGAKVELASVEFTGNSEFSEAELLEVLGPVQGEKFDLAGLRELVLRISQYYHEQGYPFARAYLPAQSLNDGALRIDILEGRYGRVTASGDESLVEGARRYLAPLSSGEVITSQKLERQVLLLNDLPGIDAAPVIRPAQQTGAGDLDVEVQRSTWANGQVGFDNHGNRYSGKIRGFANIDINSAVLFGDQISVRTLVSEEELWLGSLAYSAALGSSGLRGSVGYAETQYELGGEFEDLEATGSAEIISAGLSYPLLRSQQTNLLLSVSYEHKHLEDSFGATDVTERKVSNSVPMALQFDHRDNFAGGGITYGNLTWTHGQLRLDDALKMQDQLTADSNGSFDKLNLDVARLQLLPHGFTGYGRIAGQWAGENLDSSEGFGLGGATAVRAYPVGEGYGDEGWFVQTELRYAMGNWTPFVFYDNGRVTLVKSPWADDENHRSIAGAGTGLRYNRGGWGLEGSLAWRTAGGAPESDSRDDVPVAWFSARYGF